MQAQYYENVWFFYTPVKTSIDPQINFDWGTGLITSSASNYVSIRWQGKVKPFYTETFTFFATTDDGARLWVNDVLIIDRWDSFCNDTIGTLSLAANKFYGIKMEYKQIVGTAYSKLSWASQSTPKEILPTSQLYFETDVTGSPSVLQVFPGFCHNICYLMDHSFNLRNNFNSRRVWTEWCDGWGCLAIHRFLE